MDKIRFAFIGCGGNACGHVARVLEMPETEVLALCDVSEASIARMKERNPAVAELPIFESHKDLLDNTEVDAIEISTPHTLHYDEIMDALDHGCHVLTEKPMVCSVKHAKEIIQKAKALDKILMVSYQRHFAPPYRFVRNQIQSGDLGQIQFINALQDQKWYQGQKGQWRQKMSLSGGGQLNDSGSHLLDIVLWMTNLEVEEVQAYMDSFDTEVDINSSINLKFKGGAMGTLSVVGGSPVSGMWEDITIWGTKAVVYMRNGKVYYKTTYSNDLLEPSGLPGASNPDKNFVDAILGRDVVQSPPECGLRVIQLTEAAWESAKTGQPAKVKA